MFNVVKRSDPSHAELAASLTQLTAATPRFDYNGLVRTINSVDTGEIIAFGYKKNKVSSLVSQLAKRDLKRDKDYIVVVAETETGEEQAFITRLSDHEGKIVDITRGRRPMTDEEKAARRARREAAKKADLAKKAEATAAAAAASKKAAGAATAKPAATGKKK